MSVACFVCRDTEAYDARGAAQPAILGNAILQRPNLLHPLINGTSLHSLFDATVLHPLINAIVTFTGSNRLPPQGALSVCDDVASMHAQAWSVLSPRL
jgi:hypothetical protein